MRGPVRLDWGGTSKPAARTAAMNLHPTDEQVMLADSIDRFARDHAA
jgi:hypothetical protein